MSSNIIRARASGVEAPVSVIRKESHDASVEAREILRFAEERSSELIAQAEQEKERIFAESAQQGYAAGVEQWNEILIEARRLRDLYISRNEAELLKLSVAIAQKVIGQSVQQNPSAVLETVRQAVKSVRSERRIMIRVNPQEESALQDRVASLKTIHSDVGELAIVADPAITAGGCVVESEVGIIDAQVETQLKAIENVLLRRSNGSGS
jgi:type III secretion protein L